MTACSPCLFGEHHNCTLVSRNRTAARCCCGFDETVYFLHLPNGGPRYPP